MNPRHALSFVIGTFFAVLSVASSQTMSRQKAPQVGSPTEKAAQVKPPPIFKQYDVSAVVRERIRPGKEVIFRDTDGWPIFMRTAQGLIIFEYDEKGNLAFAFGPGGYNAEYVYDRHGRLHSIRYADGTVATANYSADGRFLVSLNKNGKVCAGKRATVENFVTKHSPYGIRVEATMYRDAFAYGRGQFPKGSSVIAASGGNVGCDWETGMGCTAEDVGGGGGGSGGGAGGGSDWSGSDSGGGGGGGGSSGGGCDWETGMGCTADDIAGSEPDTPIIIIVGERYPGDAPPPEPDENTYIPVIIISAPRPVSGFPLPDDIDRGGFGTVGAQRKPPRVFPIRNGYAFDLSGAAKRPSQPFTDRESCAEGCANANALLNMGCPAYFGPGTPEMYRCYRANTRWYSRCLTACRDGDYSWDWIETYDWNWLRLGEQPTAL